MNKPTISVIVAMDLNRVIGYKNQMPWHLPAELAYFKKVTMGHPIIMGRKTHESIGRPLPGRTNIIITRDRNYRSEGCEVVHSAEEALELLPKGEESFVIGGAEIIALMWPYADKLYITHINHEFEGDTYFPEIDEQEWELISSQRRDKDDKNPYDFEYRIYQRIRKESCYSMSD